jgi:hypothetical protein
MKKILFIFFLILLSTILMSQSIVLKGRILDETSQSFIGASVFILTTSDSAFVKGTTSDEKGRYVVSEIPKRENYLLKITALGYTTILKKIDVTSDTIKVSKIQLLQDVKYLKEVKVEGKAALAVQNGDTSSYNASAFKVNKDANAEDLVTKMPGVSVIDGKVQTQGEEVKQILVDGKPFFGEDVNAALKNLPAEVIDKVQVFDRKSDQTQFTGFDDGNTTKTINITTKQQFRNGLFGRVYGGYGYPNDKYKAGATLNYFKGNKRLTVLMQTNNINEQNFSSDDLAGVMASSGNSGGGNRGGGRGGRGGGGMQGGSESFQVNSLGGITTTRLLGINYADKFGKKTDFSGSYFLNYTDNNATSSLLQQYVLGSNSGLNYNETNVSNSLNTNHRVNFKFETKLDSQNSFLIQPRLSFQLNSNEKYSLGTNVKNDFTVSNIDNLNSGNSNSYSFSSILLYRHAFAKRGRTISLSATPSISNTDGYNLLYTKNQFFTDTSSYNTLIDQRSDNNKTSNGISGNVSYTEPLSKNSFLMLTYNTNYNYNFSSKITNNKDTALNTFSIRDSILTNVFKNDYQTQSGSAGYRFQKEKINLNATVAYQWALLNREQINPESPYLSRDFKTILPSLQLQYKFTQKKNLRVNYRTANNPPSVSQLQNVINNANPLQLKTGNQNLNQDYQHNLFVRYSASNTEKATAFFAMLGGSYSDNYVGNSTLIANNDTVVYDNIFLSKGTQISRPVNLNGYYTLRTFWNYTFPITKIKTNLSINLSGNYSNVPGLINNELNLSKTSSGVLGLVFSSNISEKIDYTLSSNSSVSNIQNTLQTSLNTNFLTQTTQFKINANPYKGFVISADYLHVLNSGLSASFNQSYSLFNAGVGYKFLKAKSAELRFIVFDILNQNNSIQRTNTDTYIQDSRTNALNRYYMLVFTYNFRKYFEAKK